MFYGVEEVMAILQIQRSKAYYIISDLRKSLEKEGYIAPPAGRIQKTYFCERFNLSLKECEKFLKKGVA